MLEIMYHIPNDKNIQKIVIDKDVVDNSLTPKIIYKVEEKTA